MGIKNLYKFIEKYAPDAITQTKIDKYINSKIAIDFNLMIYKLIYSIRRNGYDIKNGDHIVTHIHALLLKIVKFKELNILPVFVFDGKAPAIKSNTLIQRKKNWKKMSEKYEKAQDEEQKKKYFYTKSDITDKELNDCKKLIKIMGYQVIESPQEADAQLAFLSKKNLIQYIVSDDMDILLFGGDILLKKFSVATNKKIQEINLEILKKNLNFSQHDLIKLGVLLGSDYCDNSPMSINKAYKILKNIEESNIEIECNKAIKYFKKPIVEEVKYIDDEKKVNIKELYNFLKEEHNFSDNYINNIISKISD